MNIWDGVGKVIKDSKMWKLGLETGICEHKIWQLSSWQAHWVWGKCFKLEPFGMTKAEVDFSLNLNMGYYYGTHHGFFISLENNCTIVKYEDIKPYVHGNMNASAAPYIHPDKNNYHLLFHKYNHVKVLKFLIFLISLLFFVTQMTYSVC